MTNRPPQRKLATRRRSRSLYIPYSRNTLTDLGHGATEPDKVNFVDELSTLDVVDLKLAFHPQWRIRKYGVVFHEASQIVGQRHAYPGRNE